MKTFFFATCLAATSALTLPAQAQSTPNTQALSLSCADFQRNADGSWTTQRATLVPYPNGIVPMTAGTRLPGGLETHMGLRLGAMLDQQCGTAGRR